MEWLKEVWGWVVPLVSGISLSAILTAIISGITKGATNKIIAKFDVKSVVDQCLSNTMNKVETTTYSVNIEPLVSSKLATLNDTLKDTLVKHTSEQDNKLKAVGDLISVLGDYFSDSIGVAEEKKIAFTNAKNTFNDLFKTDGVKSIEVKVSKIPVAEEKAIAKKQGAIR